MSGLRLTTDEVLDLVAVSGIDAEGKANEARSAAPARCNALRCIGASSSSLPRQQGQGQTCLYTISRTRSDRGMRVTRRRGAKPTADYPSAEWIVAEQIAMVSSTGSEQFG